MMVVHRSPFSPDIETKYKNISKYDHKNLFYKYTIRCRGFPGGTEVKNPPANAGDMGSSPGLGRSHMPWSN